MRHCFIIQKLIFSPLILLFCFSLTPSLFAAPPKSETEKLLEPLKKWQAAIEDKAKKQKIIKNPVAKESQFDGLRLEGVASGSRGGEDVAILNGEAYRKGETVKGYRILEVHPSYIEIENTITHAKRNVWVHGTPSNQEMDAIGFEQDLNSSEAAPAPQTWNQKLNVALVQYGWGKKKVIDQALLDLRRVENALDQIKRERPEIVPEFSEIVKKRYLAPDFFREQFFYYFTLDASGVYAEPRKAYPKLPHFFIGSDGIIRSEAKAQATVVSKPWEQIA